MPEGKFFLSGFVKGAARTAPNILEHLRIKKEYEEGKAENASNRRIGFLMQVAQGGISQEDFISYAKRIGATQEEIDLVQPILDQSKYQSANPLQPFYNWATATHHKTPEGETIEVTPEMKKSEMGKSLSLADIPEKQREMVSKEFFGEKKPERNTYEIKTLKEEYQKAGEEEKRYMEEKYPDIKFFKRPRQPSAAKPKDRTLTKYNKQLSWFNEKIKGLEKKTKLEYPEDVDKPKYWPPDYEQNLKKLEYLKQKKIYLEENIATPYKDQEYNKIQREFRSMGGKIKKTGKQQEDLSKYKSATNPQTGEKVYFKDGKWQKL